MNATVNTPNTPAPTSTRTVIESNHIGGRWIDRIYKSGTTDAVELINKDSTRYRGKVSRRRITVQDVNNNNFFAIAYESADGRWFDNCGIPIKKPNTVAAELEIEQDL
ncbi:hypothetical protein EB001_04315 [bacterium]|nr:hypothetical protein [bacterium]